MTMNIPIKIFTCTLFVFALLITACTEKTPSLPTLPADAVIVAFGDSLTFGTGAKKTESYPAVLSNLTHRTVINAGVPGELSAEGIPRLKLVLEKYSPALLILCHGGNDLLRKKSKSKLKNNLIKMIGIAHAKGVAVVLVGVPEPKLVFMKTAPLYNEIAQQLNIPVDIKIIANVESDNRLKSDRIHPNKAGYQLIAEAIHQLLVKSGTI